MSATIDCVYLAAIAQYKLSAQTAYPAPSLRLLVGHSNLLGTLVPELVDLGVWSLETPPQPKPEEQSDSPAKSKLAGDFGECSDGGNFDWNSSDSDDDSTSSSDWSDDEPEDDNSQRVETKNASSQPRIADTDDGVTELSLLKDHLAHLRFLASQIGADSSWLTAELEGRHTDDEPSIQAPVAVSSEKAMAEISRDPSAFHPGRFCLPPRNSARLAEPGVPVPA